MAHPNGLDATVSTPTSQGFYVAKPPKPPPDYNIQKSVFLAGSIEMGTAIDWQSTITNALSHHPITILNPRREEWDSSWEQDITNKPFREQVEWELDALDNATVIAMFFDPASKAPISLLELGLYAASGRMAVCCPEGYWRRGNVQVICDRFDVKLVGTMEELITEVVKMLSLKDREAVRDGSVSDGEPGTRGTREGFF